MQFEDPCAFFFFCIVFFLYIEIYLEISTGVDEISMEFQVLNLSAQPYTYFQGRKNIEQHHFQQASSDFLRGGGHFQERGEKLREHELLSSPPPLLEGLLPLPTTPSTRDTL